MQKYNIALVGANPLLLHHDNISWAGLMNEWNTDPANKAKSVAGDDRTPAHRWIGCLYHEGGRLIVPSDNLMTMLREGGARCPTGKKGATFKRQTQSGLVVDQSGWSLTVDGKEIPYDPIAKLIDEPDFTKHEKTVAKMGFALFVKRARVNQTKHVRVRPRFDRWEAAGSITVFDDTITDRVLEDILKFGGRYAGLGDWRPSSPKSPGPFGTFTVTVSPAS
jgi:hypothetical protein